MSSTHKTNTHQKKRLEENGLTSNYWELQIIVTVNQEVGKVTVKEHLMLSRKSGFDSQQPHSAHNS